MPMPARIPVIGGHVWLMWRPARLSLIRTLVRQ
jgi:hypothetical protein